MRRCVFLVPALVAGSAPAAADLPDLPTQQEIADAYGEFLLQPCRQLIDVCDPVPLPPAIALAELSCRPSRGNSVLCRFQVDDRRCAMRLNRSQAAGEGHHWSAWDFSRAPRRMRVRCGSTSGR